MSKDFSKIVVDFKPIFDSCQDGTYSSKAEDFQNNANAINSVLSSWIFYLTTSAGQDKTGNTMINFARADCSPNKNFQKFDLINPNSIGAMETLKESSKAYLLTSLILSDLSDDKSEVELYNTLKKIVADGLGNKESTLNNLRTSGIVLLTLNSLAAAHYHNLLKKFCNITVKKSEALAQADKDLAIRLANTFVGQNGGRYKRKY